MYREPGRCCYRSGGSAGLRTIQWLDSAGKTESVLAEPAIYQMPRMSPDGSRLAFVVTDGPDSDLWVYELQQGSQHLTRPFRKRPPRTLKGSIHSLWPAKLVS